MTTDSDAYGTEQAPEPSPEVRRLDRLVGTWDVAGPTVKGQVTYEWLEGGFFLLQHVDIEQEGHRSKGLEVIGQLRPFGETEPSADVRSRYYGDGGETFDYTYEIEGDTLTIWGGDRGSPAYYQGTFSADGNSNSGAWVYPGGGGYESTMTRAEHRK